MNMYKEKKRNFIILIAFAVCFCAVLATSLVADRENNTSSALVLSEVAASDFSTTTIVSTITDNTNSAFLATAVDYSELAYDMDSEGSERIASDVVAVNYTVTSFDTPAVLYTSDTVNVRAGAGTDFAKVGKVSWGTAVTVTGVTDNGWFQVVYDNAAAYIRGDYMVSEVPGIPYLFVGDSRTVQMQQAIGSTDKAYLAKVGEGYSYFKNTVIPAISQYAGQGTVMIINFGVNDLGNAKKYVSLINSYIDSWTAAGITVYYSAVTPVGSSASVTNSQIETFNTTLQEGLDSKVHWIDSYTYLSQVGFSSSDGLHYSLDTYRNLYSYYMAVIANESL